MKPNDDLDLQQISLDVLREKYASGAYEATAASSRPAATAGDRAGHCKALYGVRCKRRASCRRLPALPVLPPRRPLRLSRRSGE